MGLLDNIKNQFGAQFIEIIEWLDETNDTFVYRFPIYNQEIKMGAQLIVRENQNALFINEGKAADLFVPGHFTLSTQNIPILTTLRGWKYGFQSPFKAEVYFFNTRLFTDLGWGTTNPVMMRDADFGMIRLRAFGTYAVKISDPKKFFETVVGTRGLTTTEEIVGQLRSIILSRLSDAIAEAKIPALDLSTKYDELSAFGREKLQTDFTGFGLELARFFIENISLPEEVEAAIDQRSKIGVFGNQLGAYTQMQAAESIKVAAANQGGIAGAGAGIGAGLAIGNAMGQAFQQSAAAPPPAAGAAPAPPPPPGAGAAPRWSVAIEGKTYGPYTEETMRSMIESGKISAQTLAWHPGAAGWAALGSYSEFGGGTPPPLPPTAP